MEMTRGQMTDERDMGHGDGNRDTGGDTTWGRDTGMGTWTQGGGTGTQAGGTPLLGFLLN